MKIKIRNFGVIKDASMDINRLTILCGTNNSGKSYFTRTVYAVMDVLRTGDFHFPIPDENEKLKEIFAYGKVSFPNLRKLVEEYSRAVNDFLKQSVYFNNETISDFCLLPCVRNTEVSLSFDHERFYQELYEGKIDFSLPVTDERLQLMEKIEKWKADEWRLAIRVRKSACSEELELSLDPSSGKTLSDYQDTKNESLVLNWSKALPQTLATVFNDRLCPQVILLSSLRASCSLFGLEHAYFTEHLSVDGMTDAEAEALGRVLCKSIPYGVSQMINRYREPQKYFNDKNISEIYKKSEILRRTLSDLVGGEYLIADDRVVFLPSGSRYPLPIAECSSSVQSLMDVFLFVKYNLPENITAHVNPMFMIDEPEQNLHPAKQRVFARLVAILVNAGVPVFVTTHSDYFIREINALTLMKELPEDKLNIVRREFMYEDEMFLDADNVSISVAEAGGIRPMTYEKGCGFPVKSFDDTVEQYNALFSVIAD